MSPISLADVLAEEFDRASEGELRAGLVEVLPLAAVESVTGGIQVEDSLRIRVAHLIDVAERNVRVSLAEVEHHGHLGVSGSSCGKPPP